MTTKEAPILWLSLTEHVIKITLYAAFVAHAFNLEKHSTTIFSCVANSLVCLLFLLMVKGEVGTAIKRIRCHLPPGYLGFPIHREIEFLWKLARNGLGLENARRRYGTFFAQSFFGQQVVLCGRQDDLTWLFNSDRKAQTEVSWPPAIGALLGPRAVANQTGNYHRALRRLLKPFFAPKFVNNYLTIMDKITRDELDAWSTTGNYVSASVFKLYALRLFYKSAFGRTDKEVLARLHDDFTLWVRGFLLLSTRRIPGTSFDGAMKARDRILTTVGHLINKFAIENPEELEHAKTTIIGRMIYGKDNDDICMLTRDEIKNNVLNMIFARHNMTYASISTLLYHLSQNLDAMEALVEEVTTLSEPLQSDELRSAPVLNACINNRRGWTHR
jgi:cytochrome P450